MQRGQKMLLSRVGMCTLYLYAVAHASTYSSQTQVHCCIPPLSMWIWGRCGGDRMVVGFTTTCNSTISTYHNYCLILDQGELYNNMG